MNNYSAGIAPLHKKDGFSLMQCPKNDMEHREMENISYVFVVVV